MDLALEDYLPQKPQNEINKKRKWRKAKLADDKTQRKCGAIG